MRSRFLYAKASSQAESANALLLRDVADWVLDKRRRSDSGTDRPSAESLIDKIVKGDGNFLRITTEEVLAYLQWLTRFAEAEFRDDKD